MILLFSVVNDINLHNGLKLPFNPDISKYTQEVTFSKKAANTIHPSVFFNDIPVVCCSTQKHFEMYLHKTLNFGQYITEKNVKPNKDIGDIKKLHNVLPCRALRTFYKCFIRTNLDLQDFINDHRNNYSFCSKTESIRYNAALAITSANITN